MKRLLVVAVLLALPLAPALAQESNEEACTAGELNLAAAESGNATSASTEPARSAPVTSDTPAVAVEPSTDAETRVQDIIAQDGLHVVHFWAPWCPNATSELDAGWSDLITSNPNVSFTFVSIWDDGELARDQLDEYDIPGRVTTLQQPDLGPSDDESNRRKAFLGIPVTWSPSTWVFHNNGELAFAMNYGEMEMETIQTLLDATKHEW